MTESKPTARARLAPAGLMFLAITSVGWGFNWPVTKYLLGELPPLTLRGSTGVVGAALLAALALLRGQSLCVAREMWLRLALAALLNVTGWMVLMGLALLWLPASETALIAYTMPVWASILAWPVLGERPTLLRTIALLMAFLGLGCLPVAIAGLAIETTHLDKVTPVGGWLLVYSTVIQFCIAYVSWFAALSRLPASVAAIGTMAVPVIGVVASAIALHEPLGPAQIAALTFTLLAVVLATRS